MRHYDGPEPINLGGGADLSIAEVARSWSPRWSATAAGSASTPAKPDGMPLKGLDSGRCARLGWRPSTDFRTALAETYDWFLATRRHRRTRTMYERLYRSLYRIRRVEEEIARVYPTDKIKSPVHLSIGQEAVSVGVCEALRAAATSSSAPTAATPSTWPRAAT